MGEHYQVKAGALGGRYVIARLGKMRKAREWLVQPTDDDRIIVQGNYLAETQTLRNGREVAKEASTGAIGVFDVSGRNGRLCTSGGYFPHLAIAAPFEFPAEFVRTCLDIAHPLDSQTDAGCGVIVDNTVRVIR